MNKCSWKHFESEAGVRSPAIVGLLICLPRISATDMLRQIGGIVERYS